MGARKPESRSEQLRGAVQGASRVAPIPYHRKNAYPRANLPDRGETETGGDIPLPQGEGCTPKVT